MHVKNSTITLIVAVLVLTAIGGFIWQRTAPSPYDGLAQCIADAGATFYGAYWCSHCNEQKELFGTAASKLPYVECSAKGTRNQLPVCREADVKGYPTWEFSDGERVSGVLSREVLAGKTNCPLPE